jgi:hypothetical protein
MACRSPWTWCGSKEKFAAAFQPNLHPADDHYNGQSAK